MRLQSTPSITIPTGLGCLANGLGVLSEQAMSLNCRKLKLLMVADSLLPKGGIFVKWRFCLRIRIERTGWSQRCVVSVWGAGSGWISRCVQ